MARISTGTGDKGETSLFDLTRVKKDSQRVAAYGDVDELNSALGLAAAEARAAPGSEKLIGEIETIQQHLFLLGADLATPMTKKQENRIGEDEVKWVEALEDEIESSLPPLKEFILPGGTKVSSRLHLARTIARRAERNAVGLAKAEEVNPQALVYLNRLSDLLFLMARKVNAAARWEERTAKFRSRRRVNRD